MLSARLRSTVWPGLASEPTTATSRGPPPKYAGTEREGHAPPTILHPEPSSTARKMSGSISTTATCSPLKVPSDALPEVGGSASDGAMEAIRGSGAAGTVGLTPVE
jgi:hypothetical protein